MEGHAPSRGRRLPTCVRCWRYSYPVSCITSDTSCRATTVLHQSRADTLISEEPDALITLVRVCGGGWRVTAGSTRHLSGTAIPVAGHSSRTEAAPAGELDRSASRSHCVPSTQIVGVWRAHHKRPFLTARYAPAKTMYYPPI